MLASRIALLSLVALAACDQTNERESVDSSMQLQDASVELLDAFAPQPDATLDAAPRLDASFDAAPPRDAAPDTTPRLDATPDATPDVAPDAMPDAAPSTPDAAYDAASPDAGTWTATTIVARESGIGSEPSLSNNYVDVAMRSNGRAALVVSASQIVAYTSRQGRLYYVSENNDGTWTRELVTSTARDEVYTAAIAVDESDIPYILVAEDDSRAMHFFSRETGAWVERTMPDYTDSTVRDVRIADLTASGSKFAATIIATTMGHVFTTSRIDITAWSATHMGVWASGDSNGYCVSPSIVETDASELQVQVACSESTTSGSVRTLKTIDASDGGVIATRSVGGSGIPRAWFEADGTADVWSSGEYACGAYTCTRQLAALEGDGHVFTESTIAEAAELKSVVRTSFGVLGIVLEQWTGDYSIYGISHDGVTSALLTFDGSLFDPRISFDEATRTLSIFNGYGSLVVYRAVLPSL